MSAVQRLRRQLPGVLALALLVGVFFAVRLPGASAAERSAMASKFGFTPMSLALPGGYPQQTTRKVNKDYEHIRAWISSVGAAVAMNDLDGDGLSNDICLVDPRTDQVYVTPAPSTAARYEPFALSHGALPWADTIAPMGCVPTDLNEDGRMDILVYYWGRTPVGYLARASATRLSADAYQPTELVPGATGGAYHGPQWNTNAVAVDDLDGDGHLDIFVGNYFPHGPVLDDSLSGGVAMNDSMSRAFNGGDDYILRWTGATAGNSPTVTFTVVDDALPTRVSRGWELAAGANDLDGDGLPELYLGNDFGPDHLLYNRSTPGNLKFSEVTKARTAMTPKSERVGGDSFKGMGVDFGDLDGDGLYDMFVSNITTTFGLQESNFAFINSAKDQADVRRQFAAGKAPFDERSADLGLAWSGWGWDVKLADFNNSGELQVAQATGFLKGDVNRWPQLQELATANDDLLDNPLWWPNVKEGDDIGGSQRLHFFVKGADGRYSDLAAELGLNVPVPTRGIAIGDVDGDGLLDFTVARQWEQPVFYRNTSRSPNAFLGLRLTHEQTGSPAVGAQVTVTRADGRRFVSRVDGGSGHAGKRSSEVHIGLGPEVSGPLQVHLRWRDRTGQLHDQDLQLTPGWHSVRLGTTAQER